MLLQQVAIKLTVLNLAVPHVESPRGLCILQEKNKIRNILKMAMACMLMCLMQVQIFCISIYCFPIAFNRHYSWSQNPKVPEQYKTPNPED